jgi:hypothetical protein
VTSSNKATHQQLQQLNIGEIMLNQKPTQIEIAVRLYDNKTYGTTYGKGKYRRAVYNGTIEAKSQQATYLVDFYNYDDWANMATSDVQMAYLADVEPDTNTLYSWIKHYDRDTRSKTAIEGICAVNMDSLVMGVIISDNTHGVVDGWELQVNSCKTGKTGAPQLLATNADLSNW